MVELNFSFARTPRLYFAEQSFARTGQVAAEYGKSALIMTGNSFFKSSPYYAALQEDLAGRGITCSFAVVAGEPSPELIDGVVSSFYDRDIAVVIAIGGGSVMDAGKAVSAMLPTGESVKDYLEGVGDKVHDGRKVPFVAVPTTAGTGSEATKNAVISSIGEKGFKKSLRHENFVPDVAIIDPVINSHCPPALTAACGMDALTQLLESYLSPGASPLTDILAINGLAFVSVSLQEAFHNGGNLTARAGMSYGAYLSGITLANAGLGIVHGLASEIGGMLDIPHGVICGTLLGAAAKATINKLQEQKDQPEARHFLEKYRQIGVLFLKEDIGIDYIDQLAEYFNQLADELAVPKLGKYGFTAEHARKIAAKDTNKSNPAQLSEEERREILLSRIG